MRWKLVDQIFTSRCSEDIIYTMNRYLYILAFGLMAVLSNPIFADGVAPDKSTNDAMWIPSLLAVVLGIIVTAVSILNPKRGHQD